MIIKKELCGILDSTDLKTTQLLSFINKYMREMLQIKS